MNRIHVTLKNRQRFHGRRPRNRRQMRKRWKDRRNWRPDLRFWETRFSYGALDPRTGQPWAPDEPKFSRCLTMHSLAWEQVKSKAPYFAARCDVFVEVPVKRHGIICLDEKQVWPEKDAGTWVKVFDDAPLPPARESGKVGA